jgi:hypothetical protein
VTSHTLVGSTDDGGISVPEVVTPCSARIESVDTSRQLVRMLEYENPTATSPSQRSQVMPAQAALCDNGSSGHEKTTVVLHEIDGGIMSGNIPLSDVSETNNSSLTFHQTVDSVSLVTNVPLQQADVSTVSVVADNILLDEKSREFVNKHKFERRQLIEKAKTLRTLIQDRHLRHGAISTVNDCPAYHSTKPINEMPGKSVANLGSTTSILKSVHENGTASKRARRYSKCSDMNQSSPAGGCAAIGNEEDIEEMKVEWLKSG